jgi:large subunit ribosomal protein L24
MKSKFSTHWIGSKLPRKQRKYRANAPIHTRRKMMSVHLSESLRKKYGKRNFPIHKDDNVKIMKGEFKGKTGKVEDVNLKKLRVMVGGIFRTKKDGTKVGVYFDPSNLLIKDLNLDDKKRKTALERKVEKKEFKAKPLPKAEEKKETNVASSNSKESEKSNIGDKK